MVINCGRHLEEQVDEEDLSIDKDDGGQEGGQGTVEDVRAGPDEYFLLTKVKKTKQFRCHQKY